MILTRKLQETSREMRQLISWEGSQKSSRRPIL
jgi:hypothetical protein